MLLSDIKTVVSCFKLPKLLTIVHNLCVKHVYRNGDENFDRAVVDCTFDLPGER